MEFVDEITLRFSNFQDGIEAEIIRLSLINQYF